MLQIPGCYLRIPIRCCIRILAIYLPDGLVVFGGCRTASISSRSANDGAFTSPADIRGTRVCVTPHTTFPPHLPAGLMDVTGVAHYACPTPHPIPVYPLFPPQPFPFAFPLLFAFTVGAHHFLPVWFADNTAPDSDVPHCLVYTIATY